MTSNELDSFVARLDNLAGKHDCVLVADLRPAATAQDIKGVRQYIGAELPASLRTFLEMHNGLSLAFHEQSSRKKYGERSSPYKELIIHGTSDIISSTNDFRGFLDIESERLRSQTHRCFEFANISGVLSRLLFFIDAPLPGGEYSILDADLDTREWYHDLDAVAGRSVVPASSFDDFLLKSLQFILETEGGFSYWVPDLEYWWPR
jgi:hypothetical protein